MKIDAQTILVNGVEYVPKSSVQIAEPSGDMKIVILQRGWVMVGRLERNGYGYGTGN